MIQLLSSYLGGSSGPVVLPIGNTSIPIGGSQVNSQGVNKKSDPSNK